jgi:PAS domain S-box-containing protein
MLRNIADGLVVTDPAVRILLVNPAFETLFGQSADGLMGAPLSQVIADRALQEAITEALQGRSVNPITDLPLPDGRTLRASSASIREGGESLGVVTVLRDITHEVALDRMKTDFVSLVSHEVRTPLTSVLGFAKLIQKSFEQHIAPQITLSDRKSCRVVERIHDNLDIIVSEGERLTRLINQVLDIAKMEAGETTWQMETTSITEVIHQAVAATSALAQAKGLNVWLDLERGLPPVRADQDRLVQVLTNLLSNALKFSDCGQIEVRASRLQILDGVGPAASGGSDGSSPPTLSPGDWLVVSVRDSGVGIAPTNLPLVFEKFKQVQDTIGNRPKGTGLGLPICKEIVEQHGGHIWAESELGAGSCFSFALPVEPATETLSGK